MIPRRVAFPAMAALAFVSCADPSPRAAVEQPVKSGPAPAEKPYKKPPRMNQRGKVTSIQLSQVYTMHEAGKVVFFDARPAFFFRLGHLPGAINIPAKGDSDTAIHKREAEIEAALAAGKTLVVYCTGPTCPDARTLAHHLSGFGYPASVFGGGWDEWKAAGLPTE